MKPETVLKLNHMDDITASDVRRIRNEWIAEYMKQTEYSPEKEELRDLLIDRVKRACEYCIERHVPNPNKPVSSGVAAADPEYYEMEYEEDLKEDASLDGEFPLGNEYDAEFAVPYFTVEQLVKMQLGDFYSVNTGHYVEPAYDVLIRKGFIAELNGDWAEAEHCYGGVPFGSSVTKRESDCRKKKIAEGERCYAEAQRYMETGEWGKVSNLIMRAAEMDNSDAMVDMALGYAYGTFGFPRYPGECIKLLRKAADIYKSARACMEIVEFHDNGSFDIDGFDAMEYCKKAAEQGDKKAIARLEDGFDLRSTEEILTEQVEKGNKEAMWHMYKHCLRMYRKDDAEMWYNKAIEAGQIDALLQEAERLLPAYRGFGSFYDPDLAKSHLQRAAEQGNTRAMVWLGELELEEDEESFWKTAMKKNEPDFSEDPDQKVRHKKQFDWSRLAAVSGDADSMNALSAAYHFGYPVERNDAEALKWALAAVDLGDSAAMYQAAYFLENGFGCERDLDRAVELYTMSAEKGVVSSMLRLHEIYLNGLDHIPQDKDKAGRYLWMSGFGRD